MRNLVTTMVVVAVAILSYYSGRDSMVDYVNSSYIQWHDSGAKAKELEYEQRGARVIDNSPDDYTIYIVEQTLFGESQL